MFRVHENGDGSTGIFCSKTGKLICTIRKQQKNMGLGGRPDNVVEPSPKSRSCCFTVDKKESEDLKSESDEEKQNESKHEKWDEPEEDFSAESITPEDFARCLNLVPTEKFNKKQPIDDLKSTFPLRLLSRTKAISSNDKFSEDMPITSSMGFKVLKLNQQKNFYCDETVDLKIKGYENFCRFQLNSSYVFNHPNLRCRDKKDYPVSFPSKNSKCATAHNYAFNRTQRLENLITIKTGLNTQSRKLLLSCNKRLAVSIKRMPDSEIEYCMQKRARLGPISADLIRGEEPLFIDLASDVIVVEQNQSTYVDIDLCSDESSEHSDNDDPPYRCNMPEKSNFKGVLSNCKGNLSSSHKRNGQSPKQMMKYIKMSKDSYIVLDNVLRSIRRCRGEYFVAGSNVKIPFLKDYLKALDPKTRNSIVFPEAKLIIKARYALDHAYHRPFSKIAYKRKNLLPNSNCLNHKNSKSKIDIKSKLKGSNCVKSKPIKHNSVVKSSNSFQPSINKVIPTAVVLIPVIDLTGSPSNSPPKNATENCPSWRFHCHGCGYKEKIHESNAHYLASQHLKDFHCVTDPKSFLNICTTSTGIVLEAFPGYKKDSVT